MQQVRERRFLVILFIGLMSLFFLQLLSDLIESVYAVCLLATSLNFSVLTVLFMLTSLLLVLFGQRLSPFLLVLFGELTILFRVLEVSASPSYRMVLAGCGLGCFFLFFPAHLHFIKDSNRNTKGVSYGLGFALALLLLIAFKTLNSSIDITLYGPYKWIGWVLAAIAALLAPIVVLGGENTSKSRNRQIFGKKSDRPSVFMPAWGILSVVAMVYFIFGSPTVLTRWIEGDYVTITVMQTAAILAFAVYSLLNSNPGSSLIKPVLVIWNIVFVLLLVVFVYRLQSAFPGTATSYPIYAEPATNLDRILLYAILAFSPILFVNISAFTAQVIKTSVTITRVGFGFFSASVILLLLSFFHIFTTTYDYIPIIGPYFRNRFWIVHLLAGLGIVVPIIASRHELTRDRCIRFAKKDRFLLGVLFLGAAGLSVFGLPDLKPAQTDTVSTSALKVMTYNIQQGYNKDGKKNFLGQLELIKNEDPDIIGLQETDSVRIASGNADIVRFYADQLNMYSYYGPTPVTGTFGIALLSKYPLINPKTFFMYSVGEQTATIEGALKFGEKVITVFVTHLGNDGDMIQQQAILGQVQGKEHVILMGDFNFEPDTPQYRLTTEALTDTWQAFLQKSVGQDTTGSATIPSQRIDHIFATSNFSINSSRYLVNNHSDHPALVTELILK